MAKDSVIRVNAYHGVAGYDGPGCSINRTDAWRWIRVPDPSLGSCWARNSIRPKATPVVGNRAHSFSFKADALVTVEDKDLITPELFEKCQTEVLDLIHRKWGVRHPVSSAKRVVSPP